MHKSSILTLIVLMAGCASTANDPVAELEARKALIERCQKLKKEIVDLRGKPVRRNAAVKYYESECSALSARAPHDPS